MPAVTLSANPKLDFISATGLPLVGGKLFTFLAGTSTPAATYTDSTGTIANANPIILDSRGEANVWLVQNQAYKYTLQDALGNLIWTVDNVNYAGPSGVSQTFANGSAAAPSVNFTQAPTSGLYSPAVNSVGLSTSGVSAVIVDASQNVGVGGTPTTKLDVFGNSRFGGAVSITTGGLNVAGGVVLPSGALTISAGGVTAIGNSTFTGTTALIGATAVSGGNFTTRGFADTATVASWSISTAGYLLNVGNAQPSFEARLLAAPQTTGTTVIFDSALHNYSSSYNTSSGVFTAPVNGVYCFSANLLITNTTGSVSIGQMEISVNGSSKAAQTFAQIPNGQSYTSSCSIAAVLLTAGSTVRVLTPPLSGTLQAINQPITSFSGRLLG